MHYPALSKLQGQVYEAIRPKLDAGIKNHNYQLLLEACELTFDKLFDRNCVEPQDVGKCSDTLDTPFRVKHLEALLMSKYAKLTQQYEKKVHDYARACVATWCDMAPREPSRKFCLVNRRKLCWLTRMCGRKKKFTCVTTVNQK